MRIVAICAGDEAAGLAEALGMLKGRDLARDEEIAGNGIGVIDAAQAGVALAADVHNS